MLRTKRGRVINLYVTRYVNYSVLGLVHTRAPIFVFRLFEIFHTSSPMSIIQFRTNIFIFIQFRTFSSMSIIQFRTNIFMFIQFRTSSLMSIIQFRTNIFMFIQFRTSSLMSIIQFRTNIFMFIQFRTNTFIHILVSNFVRIRSYLFIFVPLHSCLIHVHTTFIHTHTTFIHIHTYSYNIRTCSHNIRTFVHTSYNIRTCSYNIRSFVHVHATFVYSYIRTDSYNIHTYSYNIRTFIQHSYMFIQRIFMFIHVLISIFNPFVRFIISKSDIVRSKHTQTSRPDCAPTTWILALKFCEHAQIGQLYLPAKFGPDRTTFWSCTAASAPQLTKKCQDPWHGPLLRAPQLRFPHLSWLGLGPPTLPP